MKTRKKALIVSYHFPPLNTMASKRYGLMCRYMENYGYKPYILTSYGRAGGYSGAGLDLPVPVPEDQIIRIGLLGFRYPISSPVKMAAVEWLTYKKWISRVIPTDSPGWYEKAKQTLDFARIEDADIVLGTFPSIDNILLGKYIARKLRVPFVADIRDLISDYTEVPDDCMRLKKLDKVLERFVLWDAAGIVTTTKGFQRILESRYPHLPVATVYNGWDGENPASRPSAGPPYLYYAGYLYEHRLASLSILFQVLVHLDFEVRIRSLGPEYLNQKLDRMIEQYGLGGRVKRLPPALESIVKKEQEGAYVNLLPSSPHGDDNALMTTLPGKLFELLHGSAPILALAPEKSEIGDIVSSAEKGIATTDRQKILEFLKSGCVQYKGNQMIDQYSRESQTRNLCEYMDAILKAEGRADA